MTQFNWAVIYPELQAWSKVCPIAIVKYDTSPFLFSFISFSGVGSLQSSDQTLFVQSKNFKRKLNLCYFLRMNLFQYKLQKLTVVAPLIKLFPNKANRLLHETLTSLNFSAHSVPQFDP